jgi:hypothetical protein
VERERIVFQGPEGRREARSYVAAVVLPRQRIVATALRTATESEAVAGVTCCPTGSLSVAEM